MELPVNQIICGDWIEVAKTLPDKSVHCIITSPPYWGQRNYGVEGQLGLEKTPDEHIEKLVEGFREYSRVLRDDGLLWVNYGDKYATTPPGQNVGGFQGKMLQKDKKYNLAYPRQKKDFEIEQGNLLCLAWRLGLALQNDGWILRSDVIWAKALSFCPVYSGSTMPESLNGWRWERHRVKVKSARYGEKSKQGEIKGKTGRNASIHEYYQDETSRSQWRDCPGCAKCDPNGGYVLRKGSWRSTRAHEYILQFAKSCQYYCDIEAVKEQQCESTLAHAPRKAGIKHNGEIGGIKPTISEAQNDVSGRNLRDVWCINPQPFSGSHYATFPEALVELIIKVSTSEHGVCPKCGSPWARMVDIKGETTTEKAARLGYENKRGKGGSKVTQNLDYSGAHSNNIREITTLGWRPTCKCHEGHEKPSEFPKFSNGWFLDNDEFVPAHAVVLDPFAGSGRTCAVAAKLNRDYIGVELNQEYIDKHAIPQITEAETGITIAEQKAGQIGLFED